MNYIYTLQSYKVQMKIEFLKMDLLTDTQRF